MALHFVKTAVLSSEDGIDFSKETSIESEEAKEARILADRANSKPLYQQLAEQKDRKQEQYDANTKLLFAAPRGLDEEEFSFLQNLEDHRSQKVNLQKQAEVDAIEAFRMAQQRKEVEEKPMAKPVVVGIQAASNNNASNKAILPVIKCKFVFPSCALSAYIHHFFLLVTIIAKRKRVGDTAEEAIANPKVSKVVSKQSEKEVVMTTAASQKVEEDHNNKQSEANQSKHENNELSLLCDYGSDED